MFEKVMPEMKEVETPLHKHQPRPRTLPVATQYQNI